MRRLAPFLLAAIMATFPPSILLICIGRLVSTTLSSSTTTIWCTHHGSCGQDDVVNGFGSSVYGGISSSSNTRAASSSGSSRLITGVASAVSHTVYVSPSHYPMVSTTASIVASTMVGQYTGGKKKNTRGGIIPSVSAESMVPIDIGGDSSSSSTSTCSSNSDSEFVLEGPGTIKVSVLGTGAPPSCAYSLVEFSNTHKTDTIVVYSTHIEPSVVFPVDDRYNGIGHSENSTPLPPSAPNFHGEYDKDRQLHIPPRTAVTLPVSIIPHRRKPPDLEFDRHHGNRHYRKLDMKEEAKKNEGAGSTESKSSVNTDDVGQDETDSKSFPSASDSSENTNTNNSTIHTVIRADLLDMILTNPIGVPREYRAELLDSATIHETFIANTSYGIVQMKMPSVCSPDTKEYEFGLPNNLMFIDSNGGWYSRRNTTPTVELAYMFGTLEYNPTRNIQDPFMYNLYMNNPTNKELRIWEVYTTKPHLVGVYTQRRHGMSGSTPYPPPSTKMSADQLFQSRMVHRPKQNNIYVKTLRLYPNSFSREMTLSIQDLGFVIIKTNLGSFSIALDYIPDTRRGWEVFARYERNKHNSTFIHWAGANQTSLGDGGYLVQDAVMDRFQSSLKQDTKQLSYLEKMTITKSYRAQDLQTKGEGWKGKKYLESEHATADDDAQELNSTLSLIKANPPNINFGSITTGSRTIRIPIQLKNYHSKPLRIMRISIAMSLVSDNGDGNVTDISNESSGMEIGVEFFDGVHPTPLANNGTSSSSFFNSSQSFLFSQEVVLPPMNPNKFDFLYPLHVWCRFNADFNSADDIEARFYSGSILIHATESGLDVPYREWEQQLLLDHSTSSSSTEISNQYLLQIPFTGSVLPGNLGCPTESLLFPAFLHVLPPEEKIKIMKDQPTAVGNKVPRYYDRTLDITNNFDVPITIIGMKIVDSTGENQNFCSSRFTFDSMSGGGQDPLTAQSGKKWKGLSIRYHFLNNNQDHFYAGMTTKKCILSLETNRAGKQSLPLIIYNGEVIVEIERPSDLSGNDGQPPEYILSAMSCLIIEPDGQKSMSRSGIPCMKDWLKKTREGVVLSKALTDWHASLSSNERQHSGLRKSSSFKKCANAVLGSGSSDANDPVNSYFRSLLSNPRADEYVLTPIVLPFGAVHAGDTISRSILFTNLNHASVQVMATSAALGNMNVTMAIVPDQNIADSWKRVDDSEELEYMLKNSPVAMKFLSKFHQTFDVQRSPRIPLESELTTLFYRQYTFELFDNATDYIQTNYIGKEKKGMDCTHGLMLSADGNLTSRLSKRRVHSNGKGKKKWTIPPGGVGRFEVSIRVPPRSKLKTDITPLVGTGLVLETNFGQALPIIVTYSAIAGKLELKPFGYNITDVAKAQEEERMVWHRQQRTDLSEERRETEVTTVVQVPLTFKDTKLTSSIDNFAQNRGVALSIQSTFAQDIYLSELRSCNKWFNVFLPANNPDARDFFHKQGGGGPGREGNEGNWSQQSVNYLRINGIGEHFQTDLNSNHNSTEESYAYMMPLGKVLSALSCSHPSGDTSFYACALAWLENRNTIQPPGCGLDEHELDTAGFLKGEMDKEIAIQKARTNAIGALRDVVAWLSVRYNEADESKGKRESTTEGYVHFSRSHMFAHARNMWNAVASLGLNTITGHIRARTLYVKGDQNDVINSIASGQSSDPSSANSTGPVQPPLSIPVSSVLLESKLNIPKIFWDNKAGDKDPTHVGVVDFGTVHVADTATRNVKVVNPTAMTIRVRLTATDSINGNPIHDNKDVYVQSSPIEHHSWWTGTSYWMADDTGHLISASHNVTIKSGAGAFVSLLNPALHSMSAFLLGCGKRCGLRNEQDTNSVGDNKNYSPVGAASGDGSSLIGRPHSKETSDKKSSPQTSLGIADPPSFSLGRASNEIVLKPYSFAELGPVYFRPPGRGDFEGTILIENSLTGFEEVTVRGRGGWEQLVFLEGPSSDQHDSDIEFRFGKSAVVFSGSHVPIGERSNGPIVKSVRLANKGDIPVDVSKVYMASSEVMHFTHKRRHPSQSMRNSHDDSKCSERGFVLPGCVESSNFWIIDTLFTMCKSIFDFLIEKLVLLRTEKTEEETTEESDSFYKDGFTLRPNQTITMFVLHYPDCTFQTSYASIIFEIGGRGQQGVAPTTRNRMGSWEQTFRKRQVELLVGYDMSASEFRQCVPYTPPESSLSIWERKIEFRISPLLQDVLSFGLTRLKDSDGNSFMPRRSIEITLVAASFILLLAALSLDLLLTVEISATRKSCPSWKPTCRCLARADPTSSDLVSIGKEQTKHVLLSRFKKEGVLPSQMVQSDGSFNRGLTGSKGSGTHSEAIFDRLNLINESKMNKVEGTGLLPCGLGWRTAMRRGVGLASSPQNESPELQYLTRTRDHYVKKQKQIAAAKKVVRFPASPATPTIPKDRGTTINNGHSTFAQAQVGMRTVPAPAPQAQYRKVESQVKKNGKSAVAITKPAPQSRPPTATRNVSDASSKGSNKSSGKSSSVDKVKTTDLGKQSKNQQKVTGRVSSSQTDQKIKVVDTKGKQKQRNETAVKNVAKKDDRTNKSQTKKVTQQEEQSSLKTAKTIAGQKTRSVKLDIISAESNSKATMQNEKKELGSPSRKAKKSTNGTTKSVEQPKGKQTKQKVASKKANAKDAPKSPLPTKKPTAKHHPHSPSAALSPTQSMSKSNVRPPPGLLAPPGFIDQPDIEGDSTPSSPSASPQRVSSTLSSPLVQPKPNNISGMESIQSPPLNDDLISIIGSGENKTHETSSLFQLPSQEHSPRSGNESGLSVSVPEFRPQFFTPPTLEPSPTAESNSNEQRQTSDVQALLGGGSNFNVSNFLDGILSDPPPSAHATAVPEKLAEVTSSESSNNPFLSVSLDPWNTTSDNKSKSTKTNNPLAALRGVGNNAEQQSPIIAGIPFNSNAPSLLSATSTLPQNNNSNAGEFAIASVVSDDHGDNNSTDFLEPDSFYSNLLGE